MSLFIGTTCGCKYFKITTSLSDKKITRSGMMNQTIINPKILTTQIQNALTNGGIVYYLRKKSEMYACFILEKVKHSANEYQHDSEFCKIKGITENQEVYFYELKHAYLHPELEQSKAKIEKELQSELRNYMEEQKIPVSIWNQNRIYIPHRDMHYMENLSVAILIGFLIGTVFGNPAMGVLWGILLESTITEIRFKFHVKKGLA